MGYGYGVFTAFGAELRAGVEAEPAEPEYEDTEGAEGEVVARNGVGTASLAIFAYARSEYYCACKGDEAAAAVYDRRACEVVEAETGEPAAAPGPVSFDRIYEHRHDNGEYHIHREFRPFGHRSRDYGSRGRAEDGLEDEEGFFGDVAVGIEAAVEEMDGAYEAVAVAVHQAEAHSPEEYASYHEVEEVFHKYVRGVFSPGEACLHEGESRLHEEYQHRCDEYPYCVKSANHFSFVLRLF